MKQISLTKTLLSSIKMRDFEYAGFGPKVHPEDCVLLLHIHLVDSITILIRHLISIGFRPSAIVIIPKPYSTIPSTKAALEKLSVTIVEHDDVEFRPGRYDKSMWGYIDPGCHKAAQIINSYSAKRLVLIDDGGLLTDSWWRLYFDMDVEVVSVQQTASGFAPNRFGPRIVKVDVARSAAKRCFEASIISDGVFRKIDAFSDEDEFSISLHDKVGVVGLGPLGVQIVKHLQGKGKDITIFETDAKALRKAKRKILRPGIFMHKISIADSWQEVVENSSCVFGCTGRNAFSRFYNLPSFQNKFFISCSSRDVEFKELFEQARPDIKSDGLFGTATLSIKGQTFLILNGGFPINFDRKVEWETEEEISLTRALIYLGILQAMCEVTTSERRVVNLPPSIQKRIVSLWLQHTKKSCHDFGVVESEFDNDSWWKENSGGDDHLYLK